MKKIIIILCCFVAVACVFGLNVRFEHEDFQNAFDQLEVSFNEIYADFISFKVISSVMKFYDPSVEQKFGWTGTENPSTPDGLPHIAPYYIVIYSGDIIEFDSAYTITELSVPPNEIWYSDMWNLVRSFEHDSFDHGLGIQTAIAYLNAIICYFRAFINVAFDIIEIGFDLLQAFIYLLGF